MPDMYVNEHLRSEHTRRKNHLIFRLLNYVKLFEASLGNSAFKKKDFSLAERYFHKAIELNPDFVDAYNNLGAALEKNASHWMEAEIVFRKAIELNPNYADAYYNLGVLLAKDENRRAEAEAIYHKAIELNPDDASTYYNLACLRSISRKEENKDEALMFLVRASELDSKYKKMANTDNDFDFIRDDPRFKQIVGD